MALSEAQRRLLTVFAKSCSCEDCEGICTTGWLEPLKGSDLRIANRLQDLCLVKLSNGSRSRTVAGHVTNLGRQAASEAPPPSKSSTFLVRVDPSVSEKRQALTGGLDFALCMEGFRVTPGEYEITLTKVQKR